MCWFPCEGNLNIYKNLNWKKIVVKANEALQQWKQKGTWNSDEARECLFVFFCVWPLHIRVLLDCTKELKTVLALWILLTYKSRHWSLHDGKEKWDSPYPRATRCFGKMAAQQLQSPRAVRIDHCWPAVRLQPVWSCKVRNRRVTQQGSSTIYQLS